MTTTDSAHSSSSPSREFLVRVPNGWLLLAVNLGLIVLGIFSVIRTIYVSEALRQQIPVGLLVVGIILLVIGVISFTGHFTLQPNKARVLILFGSYHGSVRKSGFHWANPFYTRNTNLSLRSHNFSTEKVKVNDKRGNPIEIGAVVVWRIQDTAQAMFDVEDYQEYVAVQSESAIRHLAGSYAYDHAEDGEITLRSDADEVAGTLTGELSKRLLKAGVAVEESRITHLAYAPEIAQAMLRRQQAEAVIAARKKIVEGAVGMVEMALDDLSRREVVTLDDERRASMVSNLLVVLCSESEVNPVVNTGTLYS